MDMREVNGFVCPLMQKCFKTPLWELLSMPFTFTLKMKDYGQKDIVSHHNCDISILFSFTINKNVGLE